jgi:5,10-methylenetetrahydromethanopterin reductase
MQTPGMLVMSRMGKDSFARISEYAAMAEERGLRNLLVTESMTDSLALAQHLAAITSRIQVGTGITNIYLRHPSITALHAMTIDTLAPGRLLLGLGTSHVPVNKAYGIDMDRPLTALRDCVSTIRRMSRGGAVFPRLGMTLPKAEGGIPIYLAGISPKSIELTGEIADGSLPLNYGPEGLKEVVDGIARGATRAGRNPQEVSIALIMHCCVCPDRAVALRSVKNTLARYGSMPFYNRLFARQKFIREAEGIASAVAKGDMAGAAAAVSEEMAESVSAMGTPMDCRKKVEEFERAGASYVILYPVPIDDDYDRGVSAVLQAFGSE